MFGFEQLAIGCFTAIGLAAPTVRAGTRRTVFMVLACAAVVMGVLLASRLGSTGLRVWLPHLYLVLAYWIPALLVARPAGAFETWLVSREPSWESPRLPSWLVQASELAYLFCYPMVPLAFAVVYGTGGPAAAEQFWLSVLGAGCACYASLPWLVSRPPRLAGSSPASQSAIGRLNERVLGRVSHNLNTFPSGHVAVSVAAAFTALTVSGAAGIVLAIVAAGIALGALIGRHHYVMDVVLGAIVGMAAAVAAFIGVS